MKCVERKLRSQSGESLTETLIALLVVCCGSVLLATMLSASHNIIAKTREQDAEFYEELSNAECTDGIYDGFMILTDERGSEYHFPVKFSNNSDDIASYSHSGEGLS